MTDASAATPGSRLCQIQNSSAGRQFQMSLRSWRFFHRLYYLYTAALEERQRRLEENAPKSIRIVQIFLSSGFSVSLLSEYSSSAGQDILGLALPVFRQHHIKLRIS